MVVGFNPLVVCEEKKEELEAKQFYEPLQRIFLRFGVVSIRSLNLMFIGVVFSDPRFWISGSASILKVMAKLTTNLCTYSPECVSKWSGLH
jgi:hypothetical protein